MVSIILPLCIFDRVGTATGERVTRAKKIRQCAEREREDTLSNNHDGTKEKVVHVVTEDCVDDADSVEIGEFGLGFPWSDAPLETERVDDVLHTLCEPMHVSTDTLSTFDGGSVWAIEDEEWEEGQLE